MSFLLCDLLRSCSQSSHRQPRVPVSALPLAHCALPHIMLAHSHFLGLRPLLTATASGETAQGATSGPQSQPPPGASFLGLQIRISSSSLPLQTSPFFLFPPDKTERRFQGRRTCHHLAFDSGSNGSRLGCWKQHEPPEGLGYATLPFTSCVSLGKSLYLFEPQFCYL